MEQVYFAEELEGVRERWLETSFGNVFCIAAGKIGQPLIIIVHGSGPKNSSQQYRALLQEYLVRVSYLEKFYLIGIDCPGYGKSKGSKEAIKTFPLKLFSEILEALSYRSYFAMFGHSQGGAAIFNAVFEEPSLTEFMIMDRPVCGNIQRFRQFHIPTLLVYDLEDDGHPVRQGKLLMKELKRAEFHSYRSSKDPYWAEDNIWNLMLAFFANNAIKTFKESRKSIYSQERQALRNSQAKSNEKKHFSLPKKKSTLEEVIKLAAIDETDKSEIISICSSSERKSGMSVGSERKKKMNYEKYLLEKEEIEKKIESEFVSYEITKNELVNPIVQIEHNSIREKKDEIETVFKNMEDLQKENRCAICMEIYYRPVITNCLHTFCKKCICESMLVKETCPLCRQIITKKTDRFELHEEIIKCLSEKEIKKREDAFQRLENMLKSIVKIEIGNNSVELNTKKSIFTKTKKKYNWEIYVKQPRNFILEEVSFNINMGELNAKPVRVRNAPFTFESRGTFSFSCEITIKPKNKEYAEQVTIYRINVEPGNHSSIISLKKKCYDK